MTAQPTKFEGERKRNSLTDYGLQILSEKYELTVDADIDDVRRDKTGQVLRRVGEMGAKMGSLDERLISAMMESTATCYDGVALWSASHKIGKTGNTQSNDITVSGMTVGTATPDAPDSAGMSRAILAGVKNIIGLLDDRGDPMNQGAKTKPAAMAPTDSSSSGTSITSGLSCGFSGPWWAWSSCA